MIGVNLNLEEYTNSSERLSQWHTKRVFLLNCLLLYYLAGYLAGNGLPAGNAAKFSAGFS